MLDQVRVVIINFQTPDLLKTAVDSFVSYYPEVKILILDNGSKDSSPSSIKELVRSSNGFITASYIPKNIMHGPAMHYAIQHTSEEFIFFLDSDTKTLKGNFLEEINEIISSSENIYAVGKVDKCTKRGFLSPNGTITSVRTPYMLIRRKQYFNLHPFFHHGMPTIKNFIDANQRQYIFYDYPIQDYIEHFGRGTAGKFGYHLGLKAKFDYLLNKLGF